MSEPLSRDRLQQLLGEVCRLVADRAPAEVEIPEAFETKRKATEKRHEQVEREAAEDYAKEKAATEQEYESAGRALAARFETDYRAVQREYDRVRKEIARRFETAESAERRRLQNAQWEATTVFEATKDGAKARIKELKKRLDTQWGQLEQIHQDAVRLLQRRSQWREFPDAEIEDSPADGEPLRRFSGWVESANRRWNELSRQTIPRLFEGAQPWGLFLLICLATFVPAGLVVPWKGWPWAVACGVCLAGLWGVVTVWLFRIARRQSTGSYLALRDCITGADRARRDVLQAVRDGWIPQHEANVRRLNTELKKADDQFSGVMNESTRDKEADSDRAETIYPARLIEISAMRDRQRKETDDEYAGRLQEIDDRHQAELNRVQAAHAAETAENQRHYQQQWDAMAESWHSGMTRIQSTFEQINAQCDRLFPDWNEPGWDHWTAPEEVPAAIRFGTHEVDMARVEGGIVEDERLELPRTVFSIPALLPFPDHSAMLLHADAEGGQAAVEVLQAVMLRMLTSMPVGRVRFTIVDPVGLGENFAAFMHLADYDEKLVSRRIWTDTPHIERQLADLTEHMENVIQLYLRNEFDSIRDYNAVAGEMAEPYRILVVANYPAGFSESAAARLLSIVSSGARCGVYTLLTTDARQKLPFETHLEDLRRLALEMRRKDGRFFWEHPDFGPLTLELDTPPTAEQFTRIVRRVGEQAARADRVEVPFESIVPEPDQWWTADARAGLDVPLGRAGATKLQHLVLGKGTSQHVLISGKTGSGKSTLLHSLITSLAIRYRPDEVQLYLIDFKKGVEFKAYAEHQLPHAKVIAIESEREFGASVLERLDAELKHRGDLFRESGVQDLKAYRAAKPEATLPRILLIIDEFQEFFVEDDRIAQDAALLLDRLVRQGRAFGVHVLLGSQTLAGAYTLARATLGQMAVRVALQCSEADAHLILSEENTAARLLTRPGEAIYNDANGQFEGNHPFQVAWLPEFQREEYLQRIRQLAESKQCAIEPPIVFEGNLPADPGKNALLGKLLGGELPSRPVLSPRAWLGAAVAIKDPTDATFPRQEGSNLLIVGHQEEAALGILANCLISLAAQCPASGTRFHLLDGTRPDTPQADLWKQVAEAVPHSVDIITPRETPGRIAEIHEELRRREQEAAERDPPIYLMIHGLSRFRDLRRSDDDYGFSRLEEDAPPSPARQFADILRDGPTLGVHTLLWCDTSNNVNRFFDRQGLRNMELRVLFQMNANDSSNLIDSPIAGRLGIHRAVFYHEGLGQLEKFRPYGPPTDEWLGHVKRLMNDSTSG